MSSTPPTEELKSETKAEEVKAEDKSEAKAEDKSEAKAEDKSEAKAETETIVSVSVSNLADSHTVDVSDVFDRAFDQFLDIARDHELSVANLMLFISSAMRLAEVYVQGSGLGIVKKALVLRILERFIEEAPGLAAETKEVILNVLDNVGPAAIDALINADHGLLLNHAKNIFGKIKQCIAKVKCCK